MIDGQYDVTKWSKSRPVPPWRDWVFVGVVERLRNAKVLEFLCNEREALRNALVKHVR